MRRQPIIKATFFVSVFWWCLLTLWQAGFNVRELLKGELYLDWSWTLSAFYATAAGTLCGVFCTAFSIWFDRKETAKKLEGKMQYGLESSIGPVPLHLSDPREPGEEAQSITEEAVATVPEIVADKTTDFLAKWHARYDEDYPAHAALMAAIETVLMKYSELPATHIYGGHGGRTLLAHSILVAWYMDSLAPHHTYDGKIKLPDYTQVYPLRRENYKFNADDPLIAIVGLVHDIGKIECYQYDEEGRLTGCRHDHDSTAVRMLARMPEYWELSSEDRQVLSVAVKFYHHPQDTPTEDGLLPLDDRLHAIQELLIRADTLASRRERGENATAALSALEFDSNPLGMDDQGNAKEEFWNAIEEVLLREGSINSKDKATNFGIKSFHPLFKKDMLILREDLFIQAICTELGKVNVTPHVTNAVSAMTKVVLRVLDERECLYTQQESGGRNPETALYKVEFFAPEVFWADKKARIPAKDEDRGDPKFTWASTIIIDLQTVFPELVRLDDHKFVPVIRNGRLGNAGKRGSASNKSAEEIILENELTGKDDRVGTDMHEFKAQQAAKAKEAALAKQAASSVPASPPAATPTAAPSAAPSVAPTVAPPASVASPAVQPQPVVPVTVPEPANDAVMESAPATTAPAEEKGALWDTDDLFADLDLPPSPVTEVLPAPPVAMEPAATDLGAPPQAAPETDRLSSDDEELVSRYRWKLCSLLPRAVDQGTVPVMSVENGYYVMEVKALRGWLDHQFSASESERMFALIKANTLPGAMIKAGFAFIQVPK